jgi:hypothetical protein
MDIIRPSVIQSLCTNTSSIHLPVVLSHDEAMAIIENLKGPYRLFGKPGQIYF